MIQFNYEGPWGTITGSSSQFTVDMSQSQIPPPWSGAMPFRVYRQPNTSGAKAVAEPLQLPAGAVIDMTASGCAGINDPFATTAAPITAPMYIMFAPSGAVYSIVYNGTTYFPSQLIFLLVGRADEARGLGVLKNYQDLNNLWVVIDPQTGLVTTAPTAYVPNGLTVAQSLQKSRSMALDAQLLGGK
jgi:hypothetical protein